MNSAEKMIVCKEIKQGETTLVKSIFEALDIQITKEDEVGRITDIHYDD